MSNAALYKWRVRYCGMVDAPLIVRMKKTEDENRWLRKMYAEERLKSEIIQEAMVKSAEAISSNIDIPDSRIKQDCKHTSSLPSVWVSQFIIAISQSFVVMTAS